MCCRQGERDLASIYLIKVKTASNERPCKTTFLVLDKRYTRVLRHTWVLTITLLRSATHPRHDARFRSRIRRWSFPLAYRLWTCGGSLWVEWHFAAQCMTRRAALRLGVVSREFIRVYFCFCTYIFVRERAKARRAWNQPPSCSGLRRLHICIKFHDSPSKGSSRLKFDSNSWVNSSLHSYIHQDCSRVE